MTIGYRRSGGLVAIAALVAIGLAGCGGSGSPHVASLNNNNTATGAATTTLPKGNPTQLLDEWASCERKNGDTGQADPTIDANGVIHITFPASAGPGPQSFGSGGGGPGGGGPCNAYLTAASTGLRGGQAPQKPDPAKLLAYSKCMQANGIPDFPDPTGQGLQIQISPGSDLNPNNPTFQTASKLCAKKTGVPGLGSPGSAPRGSIQASSGSGPNGAGPGSKGIATQGGGGVVSSGSSGG